MYLKNHSSKKTKIYKFIHFNSVYNFQFITMNKQINLKFPHTVCNYYLLRLLGVCSTAYAPVCLKTFFIFVFLPANYKTCIHTHTAITPLKPTNTKRSPPSSECVCSINVSEKRGNTHIHAAVESEIEREKERDLWMLRRSRCFVRFECLCFSHVAVD